MKDLQGFGMLTVNELRDVKGMGLGVHLRSLRGLVPGIVMGFQRFVCVFRI